MEADRRGLTTRQPLAESNFVRITANDELVIPQSGLSVPAQIQGRLSGPFNIIENENTLTVSNARTEVSGVPLPIGLRVPADDVITRLRNALGAADMDVQVTKSRGTIVFTDLEFIGRESRLEVRGTSASALGFDIQTGASGQQIYPPWRIESRTGTINGDRFPSFISPVQNSSIFKVTYAVPGERCLRCRATFVENDYRFDRSGEPILITNENLLIQAAQKIVLTDRGSNPFHPWYGTDIRSKVGIKVLGAVQNTVRQDVERALSIFQQVQQAQGKVQEISSEERLFTIISIDTVEDPLDPTIVQVDIVMANSSGKPISLSIVFTTPGAVALAGSLGQSLGLGV